jgi:hypothetical protein
MATPINPTTLVGLKCWLRSGTGIDTTSGKVTNWRDQSGNGNDLPALGAANTRPTYQSDAGDGRPAVFFDGSNDYLGPALDVITSAGKAYTLVVTTKADDANPGGAQPIGVGGGNFNGGGSPDLYIGIDQTTGQTMCVPEDDGDNNNTNLSRYYGTAEFQTLFFRQDYYGPEQNFFLWSQDFSNAAWTKNAGATVEQNVAGALAPDGTQTVAVLHTTGASYLQQNAIVPSMAGDGRVYNASVWAKADRRLPALSLTSDAMGFSVPYNVDLNVAAGSFVVAIWFKPSSLPAGSHVVAEYGNAYTNGWLLNQIGADMSAYLQSGGPRVTATGGLTSGKWHRIVIVGDANAQTFSLYVNGVLIGTATGVTWNVTVTDPLYVGHSSDLASSGRGLFRDLVICKGAAPGFVTPDAAAVLADFNRTADFHGISARFPINEQSGTSVLASVGGAGPGTTSGSPGRQTSQVVSLTVGDGNDGVPTYGPFGLSIESTVWSRVDAGYIALGSSSTNVALLITLAGAGDEVQLWGGQLTRSFYPVDYTPTTSAQIGPDANIGTYPNGVNFRGGPDTIDSNDNAPYTSQNTTGRAFSLASLPYWDGSQVVTSYTGFKGWVRDVLLFDRSITDDELAGVYAFLQLPQDAAPSVTNVAPTPGSAIGRSDPIFFDVTDDKSALRRVIIAAKFADGTYEVVHDGDVFADGYKNLSIREVIAGGWHFRIRRSAGWPSGPTIVPFGFDTSGNELA